MDDRLNLKICYFCGKESAKKYILNPLTKILNEVFLSALYQGGQYPVCEACAGLWDIKLDKINADWKKLIDELFESMVIKKGVLVTDGTPKDAQ